jgi:hypothetical protein
MAHQTQTRGQQLVSSGLGHHFISPRKPRDKKKTTVRVRPPGNDTKQRHLLEKLRLLLVKQSRTRSTPSTDDVEQRQDLPLPVEDPMDIDEAGWEDIQRDPIPSEPSKPAKAHRRILPDTESARLYTTWKALLPSLVNSLITYLSVSMGRVVAPASDLISQCNQGTCVRKDTKIQCLYFDRK